MILRDYQVEAVTAVWNSLFKSQTALVVLPTGSGKSTVFDNLIAKSLPVRVLVLFNKTDLLQQIHRRLTLSHGSEKVGIYSGSLGIKEKKQITVGMVQSLKPEDMDYDLVIVDEVHNLNEDEGRYIELLKVRKCKIVGFTATAFRSDGYIYGAGKLFTEITYQKNLQYMISRGYLVPPICKQPDHQIDTSQLRVRLGEYMQEDVDAATADVGLAKDQVIDALNRSIGRKKIVWFCSNIKHAEMVNDILNSFGERSVTIHSKLEDREKSKYEFEEGSARHLTFVTIVSEGYDYPPIDCVVLMRPTKSPGLMVQTCGRGLRPFIGKQDCLVLDYANVISALGPIDDPVISRKGSGTGKQEPRQKACPECRTYVPTAASKCPDCGYEWQKLVADKLSLEADESAAFFKKKDIVMEIRDVQIRKHVSKSGNNCIAIQYMPASFLTHTPVTEYFVHDNEWAGKKFKVRAIELGLDVKENIDEQALQVPRQVPHSITYFFDGKYPRIKRINFEALHEVQEALQGT